MFEIGDWVRTGTVAIRYGNIVHMGRKVAHVRTVTGAVFPASIDDLSYAAMGPQEPWEADPDMPVGYIVTSG